MVLLKKQFHNTVLFTTGSLTSNGFFMLFPKWTKVWKLYIRNTAAEHWLRTSTDFRIAAITTNSHYHIVYTYQLENCGYWFFVMTKNHPSCLITQRFDCSCNIDLTFSSLWLLKGLGSKKKSMLRRCQQNLSNTSSNDWLPFMADNPLAHERTQTQTKVKSAPAGSTDTQMLALSWCFSQ